jgi:hypothetical protein
MFAILSDVANENNPTGGKLIYLGACLIAAVRLAKEEKWDNSPRVVARISDSVQMAYKVWQRGQPRIPRDVQRMSDCQKCQNCQNRRN